MKKGFLRLTAVVVVLCLLLTGCSIDFKGYFEKLAGLITGNYMTAFADMEYSRPDMTLLRQVLEEACQVAQEETDIAAVETAILNFYAQYDGFSTSYALANIYYSKDLTDTYWEGEYNYCLENAAAVDAALDQLYRALAKSPIRQKLESDAYFGAGFFDEYEGESLFDETFTALLNREAELESEYYTLTAEASGTQYYSETYFSVYGTQMAELFVELVKIRQQIAAYAGYGSYPEFAYDFYYTRDYTCDQATSYLADIRAELVPLYRQMYASDLFEGELAPSGEQDTLDYVQRMSAAMGGVVKDAFEDMQRLGLYDISYSDKKFKASFEVYLVGYYTPYIFMCPTGTEYDKLTFAHEFGHFCSDYASGGSIAGVDVAEVFSQGMEYLSLCYLPGEGNLQQLKMGDCLRVYVEQAAYASFEQQVYGLTEQELTVENVQALYQQIGTAYGFDSWEWDSRDYVSITHFFTNPMYIISYVVSNDAALQLYQLEQQEAGKGLSCLVDSLDTRQATFLAYIREAELTNPFDPGRITEVKKTLQEILG